MRNPDFTRVLLDNASCHYCCGYQAELAEHWYRHEMRDLANGVRAQVAKDDRTHNLFVFDRTYREQMLTCPLADLAPKTPRTPENYRKTMLDFAKAAALAGTFSAGASFNADGNPLDEKLDENKAK